MTRWGSLILLQEQESNIPAGVNVTMNKAIGAFPVETALQSPRNLAIIIDRRGQQLIIGCRVKDLAHVRFWVNWSEERSDWKQLIERSYDVSFALVLALSACTPLKVASG